MGSEAKPSAPTGWAERKETSAPEGRQSLPETKSYSAPAGAVRYSGGDPLPVGALGFASLPTGYCPLRLPAPGNITIT